MRTEPAKSGLGEFRDVISDYKTVGPWAIGGAVFVPLVDYVVKIGPPWPPGLAIITAVAEFLVLLAAFHFGFRSGYKRVSWRIIVGVVVLVFFFGPYLYLSSSFVYSFDNERMVKGFVVRPDVKPLITPDYTADDALADSEYRAETVWTRGSITSMRLILLALWLVGFCGLSLAIASFVIYQRRKVVR
jgi:hypothetical protein